MPIVRMLFISLLCVGMMTPATGCGNSTVEKFAPADFIAEGKASVTQLQNGNFDELEKRVEESQQSASMNDSFQKMREIVPSGSPTSIQTIGYHFLSTNGHRSDNAVFEYQFGEHWLMVDYTTSGKGADRLISSFRVTALNDSLEHSSRFLAGGRGFWPLGVFVLALLSFGFSVTAFVVCLRTPRIRRKWLWAIFCLTGVCQLACNWTTGAVEFRFFYFFIPAGTIAVTPYSPWIFCASIPLGAIVFLLYRDDFIQPLPEVAAELEPPQLGPLPTL